MNDPDAILSRALAARARLRARLLAEGTDSYRLLHGSTEGWPGLALDRYGPLLLLQTWRERPTPDQVELLRSRALASEPQARLFTWNHRGSDPQPPAPSAAFEPKRCHEQGRSHRVQARHRGRDPWVFLDLRAGRRWVAAHAREAEVLNLFAYTCTAGLAAACGGARQVLNVDFAGSALAVGRGNALDNGIPQDRFETVKADVIPTVRQLAGLPVKGRAARRRRFRRFAPRAFDLVVLDPPTWATSPFGAVDIERDYPSLFKPALLATRPGGRLLLTNHSPRVQAEDWLALLERSAAKAGRPLADLALLPPEEDFPSPDGRSPLKIALART